MAAAVGGYVLGRRRKFKLALGLGLYLGAKKLDIKPGQLAQGLLKEVSALPVVGELKGQSREQLLNVGRTAAGNIAGKWAGGLADSLNSRTERLRDGAAGSDESADEDEDTGDDATRGEAAEDGDGPRGEGNAEAREEAEPSGDGASERGARPKAGKASRSTGTRAKGAAARTKGTAKRASAATGKPARRKRAADTGGEGGDDGRDD
ncbi:hypothetical protein [Nocardiopsis synnemataformans]|uniref:hypothetical protein n=1 Tax=Nocardiopsis synnemataformans TaxID=61305 RepID=UPI003EBFAD56